MATTTISRDVPMPTKRTRGLSITAIAFQSARLPIIIGCGYALLIAIMVGALYPSLSKIDLSVYLTSGAMAGMLGLGGKITKISGFTGFMGLELYSAFYGLIFGGIIAYVAGAVLPIAIENGTLDLALARPISRTRYYLESWLSVFIGIIILSVVTVIAVWLGSLFVKDAGIDMQWLIITQLIQSAFLLFAVGVGMILGSFMNASRAAGGVAVGIISLGYLINTFGGISKQYDWLLKIGPFYYAPGVQPLVLHDFTWWHPWLLVGVGLLLSLIGLIIFNRRDLPAV